ncbi:hypothetical protein BDY19DRAFT_930706 [Irpex rosettiformis]|uniref:Uncharacterized protein n=1 Tax=Irpex rosettiformis TaxID=378272 RepID=A0ACB8UB52_9APHY|nr:hypothetical protein BDY19DRAFT_930706 [Irpex rosettiformis]
MPDVAVLPLSPAFRGFGSSTYKMQNGLPSTQRESIADIKTAAKEQAQKVRGASPASLLRNAREQILIAKTKEGEGDLRGALSAFTKAACLATMFMDAHEFRKEMLSGKKGVLTLDLMNFQQHEGIEMKDRMPRIESKLAEMDRAVAARESDSDAADGSVVKSGGGSIADRMRALQNAGLAVAPTKQTSKRMSKDLHLPSVLSTQVTPSTPSVPHTPSIPSTPSIYSASHPNIPEMPKPQRISIQNLPSPLIPSPSIGSPSITGPSPHTLIPVSSFGPPSPTSSASSSPPLTNRLSLTDFNHAFPSIDELDEMDTIKHSIVQPLNTGITKHSHTGETIAETQPPISVQSPVQVAKPFPMGAIDLSPRPSSTPIPSVDTFNSRPGSPTKSPRVLKKPSNLALNGASRSPLVPQITPPIPNSLFPEILHSFQGRSNFQVLVLDVRTREEFEREHIKADAVVCIEPSVLLRENVNADIIEDSLVVATRHERMLFSNRDKFDLIALYDEGSQSFSESPALKALMRAIYELAFRKILKNMPMILVGGLRSWKEQFPNDVVHGSADSNLESPGSSVDAMRSIDSGQGINGTVSPLLNGTVPPLSPLPTLPLNSTVISGHSRVPAEFSAPPPLSHQLVSPPLGDSAHFTRSLSGGIHSEPGEYKVWVPPPGAGTLVPPEIPLALRSGFGAGHKEPAITPPFVDLSKRPPVRPMGSRPPSHSVSSHQSSPIPPHVATHRASPSLAGVSSGISYPQFNRTISPQMSGSSFSSPTGSLVSLPPQASINPSPLRRRQSDYVDQSQEALFVMSNRPPIDYPELSSQHILRPPPAVASSSLERQDNRPRIMSQQQVGPRPPTIPSDYPVTYWADIQIGTSGLKNLGNTCYMNSTIQCLSATVPFARFFTDGRWKNAVNMVNPMGTKGQLASAFANLLRELWQGEMASLTPLPFRRTVCTFAKQFAGSEQHDSQEFLASLLDGLHEDLNRVLDKPHSRMTPEIEAELEKLPTQLASEQQWQMYRLRDDSLVVDYFQGQYRSRLECLSCHHTSTTYNTFMYLTLPIPQHRGLNKVTLQQCLDTFVKEEVLEKSDAWHCPKCKVLRKATKLLSLARLPPVLLIHLKRFSVKGHFTEKIETAVDFPLKNLDLTNYMPPPLPPGARGTQNLHPDDPRAQMPPYRYDLYGVTNHFGTLSSGHYTAFISSRGGWLYCDDSRITTADPKDVVVSIEQTLAFSIGTNSRHT